MFLLLDLWFLLALAVATKGGGLLLAHAQEEEEVAPGNTLPNDPVMAGYDLVSYHSLENPSHDSRIARPNGIPGLPAIQTRYKGYVYYFSTDENLQTFLDDPDKYLPKYGGFCAWGVAWEYPTQGWPWSAQHMVKYYRNE